MILVTKTCGAISIIFERKFISSGPLKTMASGAFGGILFWTSVFPADVVKSRIQVSGSKEPFGKLLIKIFRQEGETYYLKAQQKKLAK